MKIEITTTFLDGRDRFEVGDIRTVSDEDGERFVAAGWAVPIDGEVSPPSVGEVTLNVQSVAHAQKVKING